MWKVEYLSNHWLDLTQIWNLSSWDQTKVRKGNKWKQPQMEDDLQRKKTSEYLSNNCSDLTKILKLSYWDQTKVCKGIKWRKPPMEDNIQQKMT